TLQAKDNGDGDGPAAVLTSAFTLVVTVVSPNNPPVLAPINGQAAVVGDPFSLTVRTTDADQDALHFSLSGLPAQATLTPGVTDGTAVVSWTPAVGDTGDHTVTVTVTDDGNGGVAPILSDSRTFHLVVRTSDQAPVVGTVANQTVAEGATLSLQLTAT